MPKAKPKRSRTGKTHKGMTAYERKQALLEAKRNEPYREPAGKVLKFCNEYMLDFKGWRAMERAGYKGSPNSLAVMANSMLKDPHVEKYIDMRMKELVTPVRITQERIVAELAKLAFSNMEDYIKRTPDGQVYIDLTAMSRDEAAAISELSVDDYMEGRGEDAREVKRLKVKLADKRSALVDLGKYAFGFKDTSAVEVSGKDGKPVEQKVEHAGRIDYSAYTTEQLASLYREAVSKAK